MTSNPDQVTIDPDVNCYVIGGGHSLRSFDQVMHEIERLTDELQRAGGASDEGVTPVRGSLEAWRHLEDLNTRLCT
jgi:hypothetical protein